MCSSVDVSSYCSSIQTNVNNIEGVSEQFKADVKAISEKNKENIYISLLLDEFVSGISTALTGFLFIKRNLFLSR